MSTSDLLPRNSTELERALSLATNFYTKVEPSVRAMRGVKYKDTPPSFLPYLIYEYGLGELTPYIPNLYELLEEGIDWQRVRGTPDAVYRALGWLGYSAAIEEPSVRRMRWNLFQLALNRVRDDEIDLPRIEGATQLSVPVRSYFWRGFSGYDVRALEYDWNRWDQNRWDSYSGVRLQGGQAKWSFGRLYENDHAMTEGELQDLDVYLPPVGSAPATWWTFPWPDVPWLDTAAAARSVAMLDALEIGAAWVEFKDSDGDVIGYRRARSVNPVTPSPSGAFRFGSGRYARLPSGASVLYVEALTDFGDGFGSEAVSAGIIFDADPTEDHPVGSLWLPPGGLDKTSPLIASMPVSIEFGRTVRERVRFLLRF